MRVPVSCSCSNHFTADVATFESSFDLAVGTYVPITVPNIGESLTTTMALQALTLVKSTARGPL